VERITKAKETIQCSRVQPKGGPKFIDSEQGLKNELNSLQNYRLLQTSQIKLKQEDAIPPYFQVPLHPLRSKEKTAIFKRNSRRPKSGLCESICIPNKGRAP
jgi:hypothetical protein